MTQAFWYDPALPFVESRRAQHSCSCYRAHSHPTLSIGAVDDGHSTFSVEGAEPVRLGAGDLVVIAPNQVHACNPDPDCAWSYQMLYLDEGWTNDLLCEIRQSEPGLKPGYPTGRCSTVEYSRFNRLNAELFSPLDAEHKESLLIEFIGQLLAENVPLISASQPQWLPDIMDALVKQCETRWPVAKLASMAGLSRYHFIRAFHSHTGMTPHAFQIDSRINLARTLLRQGTPLAELAQELGFSDQSHFHHAFKQRVAVTPQQYIGLQRY